MLFLQFSVIDSAGDLMMVIKISLGD